MRRLFTLISLLSPILYGCVPHDNTPPEKNIYRDTSRHDDYNVKIAIPSAWIEEVRHFNYKQNNVKLLREFEEFIKPDSLFIPDYNDEGRKRTKSILTPMFVNLDEEPGDELLCLMGWDSNYPTMAVFKKIADTWYLLYLEHFYMFYSEPELNVTNSFSPNKTFYFRQVNERGSDVYSDGYSFYKLINNRVYHCLELINEARIYGWGLYMNQEVKARFKFNNTTADEIWVNYDYKFFPGAINTCDCHGCYNRNISLIKGEDGVNYVWDNKQRAYKSDISFQQSDLEYLTAKQIACFGDFGNDTLFVDAFHDRIINLIKTGSPQQKSILKKYLAMVKKQKTAIIQKLKTTTKAGGTTFYGQDTTQAKKK